MSALPIAADDAAASIIAIRTSSFLFIIVGMYLDILYDVFCFVRFACFTFYEHIQCIEKMNETRPRASPVPRLDGLLFSRRGLAFCNSTRCMFAFAYLALRPAAPLKSSYNTLEMSAMM